MSDPCSKSEIITILHDNLKEHRNDFKKFADKVEIKLEDLGIFKAGIAAKARNNSIWVSTLISLSGVLIALLALKFG